MRSLSQARCLLLYMFSVSNETHYSGFPSSVLRIIKVLNYICGLSFIHILWLQWFGVCLLLGNWSYSDKETFYVDAKQEVLHISIACYVSVF